MEPWIKGDKYTHASKGGASVLFSAALNFNPKAPKKEIQEAGLRIDGIIKAKEILCYGFCIHSKTDTYEFNCGHMPKPKQLESTGPYRTNALMENHNG